MRITSHSRRHESALPNLWILLFAAIVGTAGYYGHLLNSGAAFPRFETSPERFTTCGYVSRGDCVIDGDTFYLGREKIRVADIDAPETGGAQCALEAKLGVRAKLRLRELLNNGPFELRSYQGRDKDQYGRKLRIVVRDGKSIGDTLIAEGLARRWNGKRRPWCI